MRVHTLIIIAAVVTPALGDTELTREEATTLQSYDLDKFADKAPQIEGKIIRLKFNYRLPTITKKDDGSIAGKLGLWRTRTGAVGSRLKYGDLSVVVPPEGAAWFTELPISEYSRATLNVIARVGESGRVELLGREVKTDLKGSHVFW